MYCSKLLHLVNKLVVALIFQTIDTHGSDIDQITVLTLLGFMMTACPGMNMLSMYVVKHQREDLV